MCALMSKLLSNTLAIVFFGGGGGGGGGGGAPNFCLGG